MKLYINGIPHEISKPLYVIASVASEKINDEHAMKEVRKTLYEALLANLKNSPELCDELFNIGYIRSEDSDEFLVRCFLISLKKVGTKNE